MRVTLDNNTHRYTDDGGRHYPSVTQILHATGAIDYGHVPPGRLAAAQIFGTNVHKACELSDLGTLDEAALSAPVLGCVNAYRAWLVDSGFQWEHIEEARAHAVYGFAGKPDRVGTLHGAPAIVDIKTGAKQRWWLAQGAAYNILYDGGHSVACIELDKKGTYVSHEYTQEQVAKAGNAFIAALTWYAWLKENQ